MAPKKGRRISYTDEQINLFVDRAREIGVQQACSELNYPSYPTGLAWVKKAGVTVPAASTARLAALSNEAIKIEDKMVLLNKMYEHYLKAASQPMLNDLSLVRLTGGVKSLMETYKLVENKLEAAVEVAAEEDHTFANMLKEFNSQAAAVDKKTA